MSLNAYADLLWTDHFKLTSIVDLMAVFFFKIFIQFSPKSVL